MENSNYNSLTDKLIQNGIIQTTNELIEQKESENFFEKMKSEIIPDEDVINSSFINSPIDDNIDNKINDETKMRPSKKRINEYDLDLIRNIDTKINSKNHQTPFETVKRFVDFKQTKISNGNSNIFEAFLYKFFPKIYRAKLIKKAITKMLELNIDTTTLLNKTIPYGEGESRYEDLIKYLNCANELQTKLKRNFN